jgi:TonB family protein
LPLKIGILFIPESLPVNISCQREKETQGVRYGILYDISTRKKENMTLRKTSIVAAATFLFAAAQIVSADSVKHLSPQESISAAVAKPQPEYPQLAKQLRLEGSVSLNAFVSEDGTVDHVEAVNGNPVLVRSAEEALKHWKFNKQTEDGKPVKFVANVTFNFGTK